MKSMFTTSVVSVLMLAGPVISGELSGFFYGGQRSDNSQDNFPLYFVENKGQVDPKVAYYIQGYDKTLYFTSDGITFELANTADEKIRHWVIKLDFLNSDQKSNPEGFNKQSAVYSYFRGEQNEWITGLPSYGGVVYRTLWPGIDLVYTGTTNKLKYEFVVQPGADPDRISLAYRGLNNLSVQKNGELLIESPGGNFSDAAPIAYQEIDGNKVFVPMSYKVIHNKVNDSHQVGFKLGDYNKDIPLILDPVILIYCGFIGGTSAYLQDDEGRDVAVDATGCAYVTGFTKCSESSFPVLVGPDLTHNGGVATDSDAFIAKVSADGTSLIYCGYIGGSKVEQSWGVAVDQQGNAYVAGRTASNETQGFPLLLGPSLIFAGTNDIFVTKIDASGTSLVYSGYIGGTGTDTPYDIAVDLDGNAYITGSIETTNGTFPVVIGPDLSFNGGTSDAFVAKINSTTGALDFCGYIGGDGYDIGYGIAVDHNQNAYITGVTNSTQTTFPVLNGPDLTFNGNTDCFITKITSDGSVIVYSGYLGGSDIDNGNDVVIDQNGRAYIGGFTYSNNSTFPDKIGPDLTYNGGTGDGFVAAVNADGLSLYFCGYLGGNGEDRVRGIDLNVADDGFWVTGYTFSSEATFPVKFGPDLTYNGNKDAFVAKIALDGKKIDFCGYVGGTGEDHAYGIAVDNDGNGYIAGWTKSTESSFPVVTGPDLTFNGGEKDIFVAKIQGHCCNHDGIRGDADFNATLNVADLTFLVNYLFKSGQVPVCNEEGDANGDGSILVDDLILLVNYLFKGGPPPVACPI